MEVTNADIKQFIRDVTSCGYHNRKIIGINNDLENIRSEMTGIKSIAPKNYIIENKKPFSLQKLNSLILDEEMLIIERNKYEKKINEVGVIFNNLPINIQNLMIELYACGYNHTKVANKHGYARQYLYKLINHEVKKVLKK